MSTEVIGSSTGEVSGDISALYDNYEAGSLTGEMAGALSNRVISAETIFFGGGAGFDAGVLATIIQQARLIRRVVNYPLAIPSGHTMLHHGTVMAPGGSVTLEDTGELLIL